MIRAILKNGMIEPLDPPPMAWTDGRELRVEEAEPASEDLDVWYRDLETLVSQLDPDDYQRIETVLQQADTQAKGLMRREMENWLK